MIFQAKTVPKTDPKITQTSTSAPQGLPEASGERPRASQQPPGSDFELFLDPCWTNLGAHLAPPCASCISLGDLLPSTRSTKLSQTLFGITIQKVSSEPLKARCAIRCTLSGRLWGACAQLDPATEPFRLKRGPLAKRCEYVREHPVKTQRLNGV